MVRGLWGILLFVIAVVMAVMMAVCPRRREGRGRVGRGGVGVKAAAEWWLWWWRGRKQNGGPVGKGRFVSSSAPHRLQRLVMTKN